jgi:large subunit ribosomal protein L24
MNSLFVKKGDNVKILAGKSRGKTGKIIGVDPDANRVTVEGCNIIVKHIKPRSAQSQGGKQKMPGTIDASNVQIVCPACNKTTRVAHAVNGDKKIRVCKKCGASLDVKQKAEKKPAKKPSKKDEVKKDDDAAATEEKTVKKTVKKSVKKLEKDVL